MENQNRGRLLEESIRAKKEEQETLTPVNVLLALLYLPFYVTFGLICSIPSILFWLCQCIKFILIAAMCGTASGLEKVFYGKAGEISWEQRKTARIIATALLNSAIFVLFIYVWGWLWGILAYIFCNSLIRTGSMLHRSSYLRKMREQETASKEEDPEQG